MATIPISVKIFDYIKAAEKYGQDPREWNIVTKEFISDEKGNLKGVKVAKVESKPNGHLVFEEIPGSEFIIEARFSISSNWIRTSTS